MRFVNVLLRMLTVHISCAIQTWWSCSILLKWMCRQTVSASLVLQQNMKVLQVPTTYWDVWISCRGWMGSKHRKTWETLSSAFYSLTSFIFEFLLFFPYLFSFQNLKKRISRLIRCWLSLWRSNNRERSSVRLQTSQNINQPIQTMSLLMRVISKTVFALFNFIYPQIWLQVVRYSPCNNHLCQQLLLKLKLKLKLRVFNIWVAFLTSLAWDGGEALAHWALVTNFGRVPKGGGSGPLLQRRLPIIPAGSVRVGGALWSSRVSWRNKVVIQVKTDGYSLLYANKLSL